LEPREAAVLRLRFGLGDEEGQLGLTRERVRQIERDALGKLRKELEAA
jgi:RNA polymerase primary sigma factor